MLITQDVIELAMLYANLLAIFPLCAAAWTTERDLPTFFLFLYTATAGMFLPIKMIPYLNTGNWDTAFLYASLIVAFPFFCPKPSVPYTWNLLFAIFAIFLNGLLFYFWGEELAKLVLAPLM